MRVALAQDDRKAKFVMQAIGILMHAGKARLITEAAFDVSL
jgi:hypothetical protein